MTDANHIDDDTIRATLRAAHHDDAPPAFAALAARSRGPRSARSIPAAALAVAAAACFFCVRATQPSSSPATRVDLDAGGFAELALDAPELRATSLALPTDALLAIPGTTYLASTTTLSFPEAGALP